MNTNNTERGGEQWETVTIDDYQYRFRMDPEYGFMASESPGNGEWFDSYEDVYNFLKILWQERTATRDRDAALAELVATLREDAVTIRQQPGEGEVVRATGLTATSVYEKLADKIEALLTNPTAHVEAAPAKSKRVEFTFNEASMMTPEEFAEAKAHPERWGTVLELPKSVEADRQGDVPLVDALKVYADRTNWNHDGKGHRYEFWEWDGENLPPYKAAQDAITAYEALHGTEGVDR